MTDTTLSLRHDTHSLGRTGLTKNDRFSAVLVVLVTVSALSLGLLLRQRSISDTWRYTNAQAGIEVAYPAGWMTDEQGNYLVRLIDPRARPYKTQYVIRVVPVAGQTSIRNILDNLTLQRSVELSAYRVFEVAEANAGGRYVTRMQFAFVQTDANPFIERLPVVVQGEDVVILDADRAIIVTLMADRESYAENVESFEEFVGSLRY